MKHRLSVLLLFALSAPVFAQKGGVTGLIVAKGTGEALGSSIVGIEGLDRTTFSSGSGQFSFRDLSVGPHVLRVRRLGFTPRDIRVDVRTGGTDTIRVELERVAVTLGRIVVKAWPPCLTPGLHTDTDSALASIVQQIRLNAEQFQFLAEKYPFMYDVVITHASKLRKDGRTVGPPPVTRPRLSKAGSTYEPGEVIYSVARAYYFQIPTLSDVASPKFVNSHCWHYGGVESIDEEEMFRVDIVAFDALMDTDVNGSFFVDKNSFQIRRSVLHLSRRPTQFPEMLDMETTTDFFEVMPSISVQSHVYSVQRIDPTHKATVDEVVEEHRTINFKFLGRRPGETKP